MKKVGVNSIDWAYRLHALAVANEALLGGFSDKNTYYQSLTYHLLRAESMDVVMDLYSKIVPHTYAPNFNVYLVLFKEMRSKTDSGAFKHIPRLWTDLSQVSHRFLLAIPRT